MSSSVAASASWAVSTTHSQIVKTIKPLNQLLNGAKGFVLAGFVIVWWSDCGSAVKNSEHFVRFILPCPGGAVQGYHISGYSRTGIDSRVM
jgi:hypothetical protein